MMYLCLEQKSKHLNWMASGHPQKDLKSQIQTRSSMLQTRLSSIALHIQV